MTKMTYNFATFARFVPFRNFKFWNWIIYFPATDDNNIATEQTWSCTFSISWKRLILTSKIFKLNFEIQKPKTMHHKFLLPKQSSQYKFQTQTLLCYSSTYYIQQKHIPNIFFLAYVNMAAHQNDYDIRSKIKTFNWKAGSWVPWNYIAVQT